MQTTIISVQNLKCGGCANTIIDKLRTLNGVVEVSVAVEKSEVIVQYEDDFNFESVKSTLKHLGYPEVGEQNSFGTKAKSYVSCAIGKI